MNSTTTISNELAMFMRWLGLLAPPADEEKKPVDRNRKGTYYRDNEIPF